MQLSNMRTSTGVGKTNHNDDSDEDIPLPTKQRITSRENTLTEKSSAMENYATTIGE